MRRKEGKRKDTGNIGLPFRKQPDIGNQGEKNYENTVVFAVKHARNRKSYQNGFQCTLSFKKPPVGEEKKNHKKHEWNVRYGYDTSNLHEAHTQNDGIKKSIVSLLKQTINSPKSTRRNQHDEQPETEFVLKELITGTY